MSSEVSQQKQSFGSTVAGYALMPTITATASTVSALKNHGKKVFKAQNAKGFDALNTAMKNNGADVFTRSQAIGKAYESYADIAKTNAKAQKKLAKVNKKGDISLWDKFTNLFRKQDKKITFESKRNSLTNAANAANTKLSATDAALNAEKFSAKKLDEALDLCEKTKIKVATEEGEKLVEQIVEGKGIMQNADTFAKKTAQELAEAGAKAGMKATAKGFGNAVKGNFIKELGWKNGKFNYFMTALQFFPNVINEVIPTFKNEGFWAGIKATGKTAIRMGADLVGYAAGGAVGRAIGSAIGLGISCLIPVIPKGTAMKWGGNIGDMVSSLIVGGAVTKGVDKALGIKEEGEIVADTSEEIAQIQEIPAQAIQQVQTQVVTNPIQQQDLTAKYANMPSKEQVKQMAYAQAFQGKGGRFNTYYA